MTKYQLEISIQKLKAEFKQFDFEYSIIQNKVDKIGDFRFKARGWLITVISGLLLAISTSKVDDKYQLIALVIPLIFILLEEEQRIYKAPLESRARLIDNFKKLTNQISNERELKKAQAALRILRKSDHISQGMSKAGKSIFSKIPKNILTKGYYKKQPFYSIIYFYIIGFGAIYYFEPISKFLIEQITLLIILLKEYNG